MGNSTTSEVCEEILAEALVDRMLQVGTETGNEGEPLHYVYIDSTLGYSGSSAYRGGPCPQNPRKTVESRSKARLDPSWSALHRVGVAATDLYCLKVFGKQFDDVPNVDKKDVLRVLDSIKLVFTDGSYAGVFYAAVLRDAD